MADPEGKSSDVPPSSGDINADRAKSQDAPAAAPPSVEVSAPPRAPQSPDNIDISWLDTDGSPDRKHWLTVGMEVLIGWILGIIAVGGSPNFGEPPLSTVATLALPVMFIVGVYLIVAALTSFLPLPDLRPEKMKSNRVVILCILLAIVSGFFAANISPWKSAPPPRVPHMPVAQAATVLRGDLWDWQQETQQTQAIRLSSVLIMPNMPRPLLFVDWDLALKKLGADDAVSNVNCSLPYNWTYHGATWNEFWHIDCSFDIVNVSPIPSPLPTSSRT